MNLHCLKEKAQTLAREAQIFVEAQGEDEIMAYVNENESVRLVVQHENQWIALRENNDSEFFFEPVNPESADLKNYIPLTAKKQTVYPNFEHLMHFGDEEIQNWIKENDCDADSLSDLQSLDDDGYIDFWMDAHPMYMNKEIYAYAGGWAMIWPDDDIPMQWDENLVFLYQIGVQNEPFIEVYYNKREQKFMSVERNT
ncbi:MAG: hypothetical protein LBE92_11585 [Chryseobacterium sp.]|jgi:hypothetical protein|uniref:hypothetical protein n=1 Tax=Chryseobacterium sp. TaxID=1871047 RepID=UPI00283902E9|nr:hypothetical protein [Chryseobacterium sp.]MDR2236755.1 hypothetical protein [Chryseobacterium sp.]